MKRYQMNAPGGLENLAIIDAAQPSPEPGQVLVRWYASSLNYHDYMVALGAIPTSEGRVPMSDGAGEIAALGEGVDRWQVGDKVMSLFFPDWHEGRPTTANNRAISGDTVDGYALEYSCVDQQALTRMPANYTYEQAATLPCAALTAWRGLMVEGQLKAGDSVLVQGSGGMSVFALQFAKAAGAYVYATTSSDEKMARLKDLGADEVFNYRSDENWGKTIAQRSGGVDHVLDIGAEATLKHSLDAVATGGQVALIGVLGGVTATMMMPTVFFKQVSLSGLAVGSRAMQEDMIRAIETNNIRPAIDKTFGFDELAQAFEYQASGAHFGKIALTCD